MTKSNQERTSASNADPATSRGMSYRKRLEDWLEKAGFQDESERVLKHARDDAKRLLEIQQIDPRQMRQPVTL